MGTPIPVTERIERKIVYSDVPFNGQPCWVFTGGKAGGGVTGMYGVVGVREKNGYRQAYVHRVMYEAHIGPIPEKYVVDHLCRVRLCCNPAHLEAVTHQENHRRGLGNGGKTHCPSGHEYDEANTYWYAHGARSCRACDRERQAAKRARFRE